MPSVHDFKPSAADLAKWRTEQVFASGDIERIAGVSGTTVCRWFTSNFFLPSETFRIDAEGGDAPGHRRFTRAGLIRLFREHGMVRALINIGETPACYAAYLGHDVDSCRCMLLAAPHELVAPPDPFAFGQLLCRDRPGVVIVDFTGNDQTPEDYNGLIRMCREIRTTTALDPAKRPTVLGFGIPEADSSVVDRAISATDDLYAIATKLCGARLSI